MKYTSLITDKIFNEANAIKYGFVKEINNSFKLRKPLGFQDFDIEVLYQNDDLDVHIIDKFDNEAYQPFEVISSTGDFVDKIRNKAAFLLNELVTQCFDEYNFFPILKKRILKKFDVYYDEPFKQTKTHQYYAFKSYAGDQIAALICHIPANKLDPSFTSDQPIWIINLRFNVRKAQQLKKYFSNIYPAYHMNKKYWVSVLITKDTDLELITELMKMSMETIRKY
ncbi:MmcQ/YjbR family DNA-binding protein [Mycoplasma seminis]|uniref:MmcQ/YjbR family DNA-binding protein n=1 Tax=Mycoplasma seminis TaxID=512749 RepID=A0ABY9HA33_9MOLU|nr:MmcQ/YjbR family DNA-binding protein [Mycoplasma seminis]WLP85361.1 MmcQ/YjbR family DNA-binding protein [Mycoplasma seminis]